MPKPKPIEYEENENGCWICTSHTSRGRYPTSCGKMIRKIFWEEKNGPIPEGMVLITKPKCSDWLRCLNPDHKDLGYPADIARLKMHPVNYGEAHHFSRYTEDQIRSIRRSKLSTTKLAEKYNCTPENISRIRNRKTWKKLSARKRTTAPKKGE